MTFHIHVSPLFRPFFWGFPIFLIVIDVLITRTWAQEVTFFRSRPDLSAPILDVTLNDADLVTPGYIFIAPYELENPGPYIYDNNGDLVWSGWGVSGAANVHGIHVCDYRGANHLCFFQGNQQKGYARGHGVIMDNHYRIVNSVQAGGGVPPSDMHEFNLANGGETALMTVYRQRQYDLSAFGVKSGLGWIMESIFQEVNVTTSEVIFEWRSLDHVDPSDSYTLPGSTDTSGDGLGKGTPWDYFHINSIDKNADGDYLISSRHTSCVYLISGKDGSIIWRLNGANSDFHLINFSFSQQHHARLHRSKSNATTTILTLFNNASNGFNNTAPFSTGQIIALDHIHKTATLLVSYASPTFPVSDPGNADVEVDNRPFLSSSQGNFQLLPNSHAFLNWGNLPSVSENLPDGPPIFFASLKTQWTMNYRAFRFNWTAEPHDSPAIYAYAHDRKPDTATSFYTSWNGATEVRWWRFWTAENRTGPFSPGTYVRKQGFETEYTDVGDDERTGPLGFVFAEAVDVYGKSLRNSSIVPVFVPSESLSAFCDDGDCGVATQLEFDDVLTNPPPASEGEPEEEQVGEPETDTKADEIQGTNGDGVPDIQVEEDTDDVTTSAGTSWLMWKWIIRAVALAGVVAVLLVSF
ncbi:MAG: hypothetical protein M1819_003502 [Sarea resinae]|nr:MAG: hypothetical protein M1819_003502 [Sarea resinae]